MAAAASEAAAAAAAMQVYGDASKSAPPIFKCHNAFQWTLSDAATAADTDAAADADAWCGYSFSVRVEHFTKCLSHQ